MGKSKEETTCLLQASLRSHTQHHGCKSEPSQEVQSTLKGREIRFYLLEKKNVKEFEHIF